MRQDCVKLLLTLAADLMGCIEQSHTGDSVIEMHINLLFH